MASALNDSRGCGYRRGHGSCDTVPIGRLGFEMFTSRFGELVVLGAAAVLGLAPFGAEPSLVLQSVQGWKERPGPHVERAVSDLLHAPGDPEPMIRPKRQRA